MPLVQALILDPVGHDQVWNRMWESSVTHVEPLSKMQGKHTMGSWCLCEDRLVARQGIQEK